MKYPSLVMVTEANVNPTQLLSGERDSQEIEHDCLEVIDYQTKVREDLKETQIGGLRSLFIDGSSRVIEGEQRRAYAIVEGES